jgi:2-polyprenyl-3-methyl-5-hydroxy-6-metoxy-1,4-benzoquinol methylase
MKPQLLGWVVCPRCGAELDFLEEAARTAVRELGADTEVSSGVLRCGSGHMYPIRNGVARLLESERFESSMAARSIKESFSREWGHFDYEQDRTWGETVQQRRTDFLRHVDYDPNELRGKVVLDAGCGNGMLSHAISAFGCEVVATDLSESVEAAHRHLSGREPRRTHFFQSDLMQPALRPESFDVIFCAGVLHHTPSTRETFDQVIKALASGGTIFVWLYWDVGGLKPKLSEAVRRVVSPLPAPLKHAVVWALLPQSLLRQYIRSVRDGTGRAGRLNRREVLVRMLDSYTPRYRWRHTPEEIHGWFRELGFTNIKTTERGSEGFGVAARKPLTPSERPASMLLAGATAE